jgi:hypothetical protein
MYDRFDLSKILRSATIQVRELAVDFFGRAAAGGTGIWSEIMRRCARVHEHAKPGPQIGASCCPQ